MTRPKKRVNASRRQARPSDRITRPAPAPRPAAPRGSSAPADDVGISAAGSPFPVVGIGASAGGLEAFTELFKHLPATSGMAFVVVQHLDPTHASALVDLLVRSATMPVSEATDGVHVQANHIHVIPPNTNLTIAHGILHLAPREPHQLHLPINQFFRSLAADQRSNAIGVILSGNGSDGTLGLEAIKFEGGLTFAQDAASAKYDGMPRSAAGSGCVDLIRPPAGIAEQLARIADHPYLRFETPARATADEDADSLSKILGLLLQGTGIDFRLYRQSTVKRRIMRRMLLRRKRRLAQYLNDLRAHGDERQALQQDLLIGVTSFFREPDTFDALRRTVLPRQLKARPPNQPLRVWVAGCSTGEEVYSLAITLVEFFEERGDRRPIQIFGTDANDAAIVKARAGLYSDASTSEMAPARLQRFFTPVDGHQQVTKRIRDLCVFAKHDLIHDPPFSNMDLITCCNVLIYFEASVQKQILQALHYALTPTGVLILGRSERVAAASDLFAPLNGSPRVHVPKPRRTNAGLRLLTRDTRVQGRPGSGPQAATAPAGLDVGGDLERQVRRLLVEQYAPPGIVVNDQWDIVHFSGRPNPYLHPPAGAASFNVLRMAPDGLAPELRRLIVTARRTSRAVRKDGLRVVVHGQPHDLSLEATPLPDGAAGSSLVMVVFNLATVPARAVRGGSKTARRHGRTGASDTEAALKRELADLRDYLQGVVQDQEAANEELKSANEEILSSNEELQSTNEEMETAKEELQSSNEELHTLNEELQHRNVELRQTSDDLSNLLTSTNLPVVMLGRDLRIRRFTPVAERVLRLHSADVGRSVDDIKLPFTVPDLGPWLLEVLKTGVTREHEVQDREGCWYRLAVRAYRTIDHAIDGVLVVLTDIDAAKRSEQVMAEARNYAEAIITTVREPLVVLDEALKVMTANAAFYDFFHMTPGETEHHFIFSLGGRQWDIPALRTLLTDLFTANKTFEDFEVSADFPVLGTRTLLLNARPIRGGQARLGLLAFEDVTERTRVQQERERLLAAAEGARHDAEEANRAKDDFLTAVSHELRTPLNVLLGWIWRLRTGVLDEAARSRALESIDRNAKLQTKLVEDLLDVSRIRRGAFHVDLVPIALQPVVDAAIQSVQPLADEKHLRLELVVGKGTLNVLGDAARLEQVVWNLLSNALKFTPPDGHIQVRLSAIDGALRLQVSDTGQGISPDVLPHIFEAFRQGDDTGTYQREGLGLGLAIVKAIVERHGGTVSAASPGPGKGATLTLELPALAGAAQHVMRTPEAAARKPFSVPELAGVHALVVDDGTEARELLGLMLQEYGASVTAVASAREAIETFTRHRPDVILSDIQMPDEDGYSLIATIRALESDRGHPIPAIAVTAYSSAEDRQRALAAGFQRHIVKPVDAERLAAVIADLVSHDRS